MSNESWSHNEVEALARELMSAYETGQMIAIPPSARPGFDLNAAYAVETKLKQFREASGHKAVGRKVGYANKAMWRVFKLETLVWAHMYYDTVHYANNNSARLSIAHPRSLKIEPEIVFGLKHAVTGDPSDAASALASVDWLALGFEIIDCPFPDWKFQPSDFVASFGLHTALVVGQKVPVQPLNTVNLLDQLSAFKLRIFKGREHAGQAAANNSESGAEFVEEGSGKNPETKSASADGSFAKSYPKNAEFVKEAPGENSATDSTLADGPSEKGHGRGTEFVEEGSGKNSLKSPALCLAELGAAVSRRFPTNPLSAGELVSSGTLTAGHLATIGDVWIAEVEGIPLPPLTLHLT
jgi:2-oxo-3-hexenedioate decarboxylase